MFSSTQLDPQCVSPVVHLTAHCPALHTGCPPGGAGHCTSQAPQCVGSLATSTQEWPHAVSWEGQDEAQPDGVHTSLGPHTVPQPPQLSGSLWRSMQVPPHSAKPALHADTHLPPWQDGVLFTPGTQTFAQLPQLATSVDVSTQALPQCSVPAGHLKSHAPSMHTAIAPLGTAQTAPQPPQWSGSLEVSTHWPSHDVWFASHAPASPESPASPASDASVAASAIASGTLPASESAVASCPPPSFKLPGRRQRCVAGSHTNPVAHRPAESHGRPAPSAVRSLEQPSIKVAASTSSTTLV